MNSAEVKLDVFRKIDSLDNKDLEKIYARLVELLNEASTDEISLNPQIKAALDEALEARKKGGFHLMEQLCKKHGKSIPGG